MNNSLAPITTDHNAAPYKLLAITRCKCKTDCPTLRCSCKKNGLKCSHLCGTYQLNECTKMDNRIEDESDRVTILMTFMNININMGMFSRQVLHTQNGNITLYIGGGSKAQSLYGC